MDSIIKRNPSNAITKQNPSNAITKQNPSNAERMVDREEERIRMVETQLISRGITEKAVIDAFREVPRHLFIPEKYSHDAYADYPLPIGDGQTISQPYIVAEMTQLLKVSRGDKILEIGTGSGYQAVILAHMGAMVYSVERKRKLIKKALAVLATLGVNNKNNKIKQSVSNTEALAEGVYNIKIKEGDGTIGWQEYSPYDGIIVTAAAPDAPFPLLKQLKEGGIMVVPIGSLSFQVLKVFQKKNSGKITETDHGGCRFVPLLGKYGF